MVLLATGLTGIYYWSMQRTGKDIRLKGCSMLEETTHRFLLSILSGQAETLDHQLDQAKNTVRIGAEMIEKALMKGRLPADGEMRLLLDSSGAYATTIYYLPVEGEAIVLSDAQHESPATGPFLLKEADFLPVFNTTPSPQRSVLWSKVHTNPFFEGRDRVIDAVTPLYVDGHITGYLGISVSVIRQTLQFNDQQAIRGSYNFLLDQDKQLIACPPLALVDLKPRKELKKITSSILDLSKAEPSPLCHTLHDMALGNEMVVQITLPSGEKYLAYRPLTNANLRLGLVVQEKLASMNALELDAVIDRRSKNGLMEMVVLSFLLLGFTLILVGFLSRRMSAPLKQITVAADQMSHGDLSQIIPVTSEDELGTLAASFNTMSQRLRDFIDNLQEKQEMLTNSETRYKLLFESSPVSLWEEDFSEVKAAIEKLREQGISDFDTYFSEHEEEARALLNLIKVNDVNVATLKLFGVTSKDQILAGFNQLLEEIPLDSAQKELLAIAENRMFEFESKHRTLDGRVLTTIIRSSIPPGFEHNWQKVLISLFDLTEHKRFLEEKEKLEKQLNKAQRMEAIGTLTGGIAHDFNNILSSIFGFTELAKMRALDDPVAQQHLEHVLDSGQRAKELVRHLLTFSRESEVEKGPILITPLLKETVKFIVATIPSTIAIKSSYLEGDVRVLANPTQMHQVFMNIMTNAVHAMKQKGGKLEINIERAKIRKDDDQYLGRLDPGDYVKFTISDTGHGIAQDKIEKIFDPFFTTKGKGEGTGLGLSVIYGIIKDMNGSIWVDSEEGVGTTFTVLIPESKGEEGQPASSIVDNLVRGSGTILLVDDEPMIVEWVSEFLSSLGYVVIDKCDPVEALKLFKENPDSFDLLLTDLTMPGMTGVELAQKVHSIREELPIVLCTGFSEGLSPDLLKEYGVLEVLMKPVIIGELSRLIDACIHRGKNKSIPD